MVKYRTFNNSKDLEEWQKIEPRKIISINPIPLKFDLDNSVAKQNVLPEFGVFVTYSEDLTDIA